MSDNNEPTENNPTSDKELTNQRNYHKGKRIPVWFPYTTSITVNKETITAIYKGGTFEGDISKVLSIMFYGCLPNLSQDFIELCCKKSVPICFHRRNMATAVLINPSQRNSVDDVLTKQIIFRQNQKKRRHIARKILLAKFKSMEWLTPAPLKSQLSNLSVEQMVVIEAEHAKKYWAKYFEKLGFGEYSRRGGGSDNIVKTILDAVSKLISGVQLRYVIYHKLSPYHAYIHKPADYIALVYDLLEPYRGYIEKVVFDTIHYVKANKIDEKKWLGFVIAEVENYLDEEVYCDVTRQIVTFQELMHGVVLSLRSYLLGTSRQFVLPIPGVPNGGRPVKVGYRLYGRTAGKTDFWKVANIVSNRQQKRMTVF